MFVLIVIPHIVWSVYLETLEFIYPVLMKKFIVQIAFVHVWVLASSFTFMSFLKIKREWFTLRLKNKRQWIDRLHNQNLIMQCLVQVEHMVLSI